MPKLVCLLSVCLVFTMLPICVQSRDSRFFSISNPNALKGVDGEKVQTALKSEITTKDGNTEKFHGCHDNTIDTRVPNEVKGFEGLTGEKVQKAREYEIATKYGITTENGNPSGEDVQTASKFGINTKDRNAELACRRDLLYYCSCHRTDTQVPPEITGLEGRRGEEAHIATNGITIEDGNLAGEEVQITTTKYGKTVKDGHPSVIAPNMPPLLPTTAKKINLHELSGRKLLSLPASPETERNTPPLPPTPELPPSPPSPPSSHTVFTQELATPPVPVLPSCFPECK